MTLCFIDTETTGLDPRIHQPYEVSWWLEDEPEPTTMHLEHTLHLADPHGLKVGRYFERGFAREQSGGWTSGWEDQTAYLASVLHGVTLVGSNPAFDAAMLTPVIGAPVWHYRLIDVAAGAMWVFGWDKPRGLFDVANHLRDLGHTIPEPDHTAAGDVATTRAVYYALRAEREKA